MYEQQVFQQQIKQSNASSNNSSFINVNNLGGITPGLQVGTVYAKPSHLKGSAINVGMGVTPPKSILNRSKSLGKENMLRAKSPGQKKVKFADEVN